MTQQTTIDVTGALRVKGKDPLNVMYALKYPAFENNITETYLYNFDPLKPHFYIVKLGFTGVTLFFLFLLRNVDCWYSLKQISEAVLMSTHN